MEVRHKVTGVQQTIDKKDWDVLIQSGHSENFEVLSHEDFSPPELTLPDAPRATKKND